MIAASPPAYCPGGRPVRMALSAGDQREALLHRPIPGVAGRVRVDARAVSVAAVPRRRRQFFPACCESPRHRGSRPHLQACRSCVLRGRSEAVLARRSRSASHGVGARAGATVFLRREVIFAGRLRHHDASRVRCSTAAPRLRKAVDLRHPLLFAHLRLAGHQLTGAELAPHNCVRAGNTPAGP